MFAINNLKTLHIIAFFANNVCCKGAFNYDEEDLSFSLCIFVVFARLPLAIAIKIDFVVKIIVFFDRFRTTFNDCIALFGGVRLHYIDKLFKGGVVIVAKE